MLNALLAEIVSHHRIDEERIYLTGLSMGGTGVWNLAIASPTRFAAIVPICGRVDRNNLGKACSFERLPTWVFRGALDPVVPLSDSEKMVEALKQCGSHVRLTVYPDAGHDAWTATYDNPGLYRWFIQHQRSSE